MRKRQRKPDGGDIHRRGFLFSVVTTFSATAQSRRWWLFVRNHCKKFTNHVNWWKLRRRHTATTTVHKKLMVMTRHRTQENWARKNCKKKTWYESRTQHQNIMKEINDELMKRRYQKTTALPLCGSRTQAKNKTKK